MLIVLVEMMNRKKGLSPCGNKAWEKGKTISMLYFFLTIQDIVVIFWFSKAYGERAQIICALYYHYSDTIVVVL